MCVCVRWCRLRGCNSKRIPFSSASLLLMSAADDGTRVSPATREQREREKHSFIPSCLPLSLSLPSPAFADDSVAAFAAQVSQSNSTHVFLTRTDLQSEGESRRHALPPSCINSHTQPHSHALSHRKVCVRSVDRKSVLRDGSRGARAAGLRDASRATAHHGSE